MGLLGKAEVAIGCGGEMMDDDMYEFFLTKAYSGVGNFLRVGFGGVWKEGWRERFSWNCSGRDAHSC